MTFNNTSAPSVNSSHSTLPTHQTTFKEKVGLLAGRTFHTFATVAKTIVAIADKIIVFCIEVWFSILKPTHEFFANLSRFKPKTNWQVFKQKFYTVSATAIYILALPGISYIRATGRPV